ncbi:MAG: hypothetical protein ACRENV_06230 [Candidatus Dormibacteria bacterium]
MKIRAWREAVAQGGDRPNPVDEVLQRGSRSEVAEILGPWYRSQGWRVGAWPSGGVIDFDLTREGTRTLVSLDPLLALRVNESWLRETLHTTLALGADRLIAVSGGGSTWAADALLSSNRGCLELVDGPALRRLLVRALNRAPGPPQDRSVVAA